MNYQEFLQSKMQLSGEHGFEPTRLNKHLFPFQHDIVRWAVRKGRAAVFSDCGTGKTIIQLEWAKQIVKHVGDGCRVLILAPLAVSSQTVKEGKRFGIKVHECRSGEDVRHGINITNYESLHKFDPSDYDGVVLDESGILKHFDGKTRTRLIEAFFSTKFKLACTATPAPNDYMELGNHSEFLNVLTRAEMLSMFFINDTSKTGTWRLKGHGEDEYWKWLCSWAVILRKPSDLGYDDDGFILPKLNVVNEVVRINKPLPGNLFVEPARTLDERREARKGTIEQRIGVAADLISKRPDEQWLVWCNLNKESQDMTRAVDGAVEITGSHDLEFKKQAMLDFADGNIRLLVTKPKIAGHGMNWQNCHNVIFLGLSDSYESYYQAIRRCWRYGQENEVNCYIVTSDIESDVVKNVMRKEVDAEKLYNGMVNNMKDITSNIIRDEKLASDTYVTDKTEGDGFTLYFGDCVEITKQLRDESIDYSIFSPPFASLFTYSNNIRDMGNSHSDDGFFEHFNYFIGDLFRILVTGRLVSIHCMNLPNTINNDGFIGIKDFRGDIIRAFQHHGFIFHSEVVIWKDPLVQATRTKQLPLAHKQICKDSSRCAMGYPDYIVTMRKPGDNPKPISRERGFEDYIGERDEPIHPKNDNPKINKYSHEVWQRYASPVWFDIRQTRTLNYAVARDDKDEKHICPLQLDVIERCLELWTNPGEIVFTPFAGIGSEMYVALQKDRRAIGIELKESYYKTALKNLADVKRLGKQQSLLMEAMP